MEAGEADRLKGGRAVRKSKKSENTDGAVTGWRR